jgi:DNA-binding winged helix-turn-helix (wHTH) protein
VASPKAGRGRRWLAITESGRSAKQLSDEGLCDLILEHGVPWHSTEAFHSVSVLVLAGRSATGRDSAMPVMIQRVCSALATEPPSAPRRAIEVGVIRVDKDAFEAAVFGKPIVLTRLQFRLLLTLAERADRVQSRTTLLTDVWELSDQLHTRTVDTHVKRLRDKLGCAGKAIETVRTVGYRLNSRAAARAREGAPEIAQEE